MTLADLKMFSISIVASFSLVFEIPSCQYIANNKDPHNENDLESETNEIAKLVKSKLIILQSFQIN